MHRKLMVVLGVLALLFGLTSCVETTTSDTATTTNSTLWAPTVGTGTNDESLDDLAFIYTDPSATELAVLPVENLTDEFVFGVDISTAYVVYENGGKYYDRAGSERDLFDILVDAGVNYVRIRLWVDPFDELGNSYGGGGNDLETALKLAARAKAVGLKICLDFHYSDFWADPGQQEMPKAWAQLSFTDLQNELYDYTKTSLLAFAAIGALPDMVELGNEINQGILWDLGKITLQPASWTRLATLLKKAAQAVIDVDPSILKVLHLAQGGSFATFDAFFAKMEANDVPYDVIGLSYYPFWHGPLADFKDNVDRISAKYGKPICVMETSYGFTNLPHDDASNIYNASLEKLGGYKTSLQGQASALRDVIDVVANVPDGQGMGVFYWEPAWLPVQGAGWADPASGRTNEPGKSTWANQGLFSYSGAALPTLYILEMIRNGDPDLTVTILPGSVTTELDVTLNVSLNEELPSSTTAIDSLHRYTVTAIVWDVDDLLAIDGPGSYVVAGVLAVDPTVTIVAHVTAVANYIVNPGLEERGASDQDVVAPWYRDDANGVKTNHTDPRTGTGHVNVWDDTDFDYDIWQVVDLPAGSYELSFWAMGAAESQPTIFLYAAFAETLTDIVVSEDCTVTWWPQYNQFRITFTLTEPASVRIGVRGEGVAGNWAHFDDFILQRTDD